MNRTTIEDALYPACPIRNVLSRIGDKWSMLVIYTLRPDGRMRFGELHRAIPDISQKMLTVTLRTLEQDGLVVREIFPEIPPRTEYSLTARAQSLLPHIEGLIEWSLENMDGIMRDRQGNSAAEGK